VTNRYFEDEDTLGNIYDTHILRRMGGYLRPYLALLIVAFVLVVSIAGLQTVGPLIVRDAIDNQIRRGQSDRLDTLVLAYVGILITIFLLSFVQIVIMTYVGQRVMMDMRLELFGHIQKMSIAFFDRNPVGRLVTRLTNDVSTLEQVISQGVVETLTSLLMLFAIVIVLFLLDWRLALFMIAVLPALIFAVRFLAFSQREQFRRQRVWLSRINAYLNETSPV
jgi:ATP-binding cassette subfamily B multidrug efflux pump